MATLFDPSAQRMFPAEVCKPFSCRNESASPFTITEFAPEGLKVASVLAVKEPLAVVAPVTVRAFLIVVVPEVAPKVTVVAAPPMLRVVALALKRFPVAAVVVTEPPLTATLPEVVTLPVRVEAPSTVNAPLAWILPVLLIVTPVLP